MLSPFVQLTSISFYNHIYPATSNEESGGMLEKMSMEQHGSLQENWTLTFV